LLEPIDNNRKDFAYVADLFINMRITPLHMNVHCFHAVYTAYQPYKNIVKCPWYLPERQNAMQS
jgi:hypothetical protein